MFLAHVAITDPGHTPLLPEVLSLMDDFLSTVSVEDVHSEEEKNGFVWSTVLPSFRLATYPYDTRGAMEACRDHSRGAMEACWDPQACRSLQLLCVEAGVFSLQNTLRSPAVRRTMIQEEGLLGYLACLPWSVPRGSRAWQRARELVAYTRPLLVGAELAPPTLEVMARAKLAVSCVGLERAIKWSAQRLGAELYPPK